MQLFAGAGAYLRGHFRLTSGLHSGEYLQCALVLARPALAERFGHEIAAALTPLLNGRKPDLVVSPAVGGLIIGHEVARSLGAASLFTERDPNGAMTLRRGFTIEPGQTAVVVEDVITTGGSTREVIEIVHRSGASVLAAASIVDRSNGQADLGVPRVALATLNPVAWKPEECPLCAAGEPVVKPGSRRV